MSERTSAFSGCVPFAREKKLPYSEENTGIKTKMLNFAHCGKFLSGEYFLCNTL